MSPGEDVVEPKALVPGVATALTPMVRRILAPNPGVMTGPGTNTYLVGIDEVVVIDPGIDDRDHLDAIVGCGGDRIRWIVCTHTHPDHAPGAAGLKSRTGAQVLGFESRDSLVVDAPLRDGDRIEGTEFRLQAVHTPGHASNHLCFLLEGERLLFSGDHIMQGSTVVIAPPDGDMAAYLASLERLRGLRLRSIAPGHGHLITEPAVVIDAYLTHRREREQQVLAALAASDTTIAAIVDRIYVELIDELVPQRSSIGARAPAQARRRRRRRHRRCRRRRRCVVPRVEMRDDPMADHPQHMTLTEAAGVLRLPTESVQALVGAGYLHPAAELADGPRFALGDLKAFLARNERGTESRDGDLAIDPMASLDDLDPQALLDALEGRSEDMARRALDLLVAVFPDAGRWPLSQRARFIEEARARFEAIVAVASLGASVDEVLVEELAAVGAETARSGDPLTEVLLVLRISRDLVVQTAVEVADDWGRHWGLALSLVLTRVLPALDRLTDAIARGYWAAVIRRQDESKARYANVVERASDGVFEITPDGVIIYANGALGIVLGRSVDELLGQQLGSVLGDRAGFTVGDELAQLAVRRPDGVERTLEIRTIERRVAGTVVGYDGVVRDLSAALDAEQLRNDFLGLLGHELRQPLVTVLGLGATLEEHGSELDGVRVRSVGERIRHQAERMARA